MSFTDLMLLFIMLQLCILIYKVSYLKELLNAHVKRIYKAMKGDYNEDE